MTTVIVNGACGRMGQAVLKAVQEADGLELVGAVDIKGGADTGSLVGLPANGILVSEGKTENARERLRIMAETSDGFKLAEEDLRLRGPGQFFGSMQHGLPDLKIARVPEDLAILLDAHKAAEATLLSQGDLDFIRPILALQYKERFAHIMEN